MSRAERRRLLVAACEIDRALLVVVWTHPPGRGCNPASSPGDGNVRAADAAGNAGVALAFDLLKNVDLDSALGILLSFLPGKYRVIAFLARASAELFGRKARGG